MNSYLFITESYHDNPSPNGNCVEKIVKKLKNDYNSVSILTLKNQYAKKDALIDGIKVYRVNTYAEWRIMFSNKIPAILKTVFIKVISLFKLFLLPFHPFRAPLVKNSLLKRAKKIIKDDDVKVIVGVYRDFETAYCAARLKKSFPDKKFVLYSLDAISGGVCSNKHVSQEKHIKHCRKWEMYFVKTFDYICPMMSHKSIFEEERFDLFKDKIVYMDIPNMNLDTNVYCKKQNGMGIIRFAFTGLMSETNADSRFFLKIFIKLYNKRNCVLDIYGAISPTIRQAIEETDLLDKSIFFHGRVSQEELKRVRGQADIFLNFGNDHKCGIPCKIFEYISTGKIIISFYKIEDDASTPYLKRYRNALILKEDFDKIEKYSEQIMSFYDDHINDIVGLDEINRSFYQNTPTAFVEFLNSIS